MKKSFLALFALTLTLCLPMQVMADEMVSLKAGYMSLTPEGKFASTDSNVLNTKIDIEDDLDIGDSEEIMVEAALRFGSFRLTASYLPLNFSGTSALNRQINFGNETFDVNTTVEGEMDVDLYDLGLTWYLLNFDDLPVRFQFGPELSVKVVDGEASIMDKTTGIREEVSGTVPAPTIGARARVGLADFLAVTGRVGYTEYSDNSLLDADAQLEFSPIPFVGIFGGYRYLDLDVDEDDILIDATFKGPYGGAFLRF
jgi:hypothetical protein